MSDKIFVIKNNDGIIAFYNNLEKAKDELIKIYKNTVDFKHDNYQINIYDLIENEYIFTYPIYKYKFNQFIIIEQK